MSALYAPIMMLVQTQHVVEILTGRDSGWNPQRRNAQATGGAKRGACIGRIC